MKLVSIAAENFKGQTFREPLAVAQLFVGSNFRGKTARTDAIRLLLMGYLPELGKNNKDTFALSSGKTMAVEGHFEDGTVLVRRWTLKGDSIKADHTIPETFKDAERFEVMMDAQKYFGLSDHARVEYVFGLVNLGQLWTAAGIESRLLEKATNKENAAALLAEFLPATTAQAFVDQAIETTSTTWSDAKRKFVQYQNTITGLAALRAEDEPGPMIARLESERAQLQAELAVVQERRGGLLTGYTAIRSARQRRAEIDREQKFGTKAKTELIAAKEKLALIIQARADVCPPSETISDDILLNIANLTSDLSNGTRNLSSLRTQLAKIGIEIHDIDEKTTCPYCGATGEGWKGLKLAELEKRAVELREQIDQQTDAAKETDASLIEAKRSQKVFVEHKEILAKYDREEATIRRVMAQLEPQIARLDTLGEESARLTPEDPDLEAKVETLQSDINVKTQELKDIELQIKQCMGRQSELMRLAQAEKNRDEAKAEEVNAAELGKELRLIQAEMVASAFAPLLTRANEMFPGILNAPLEYNAKTGEIGMTANGLFIGHHTFSGTEKALCYSAIQAALTVENPCRIMIIDELGRLDDKNRILLMVRIIEAVESGYVDQFIGCDPNTTGFYDKIATSENCPLNIRSLG